MADELPESVQRLEALVRALTANTEARFEGVETQLDGVETRLDGVETRSDEMLGMLRQIQSSQTAMASALTQAVTQLALSRDLDKRVEAAVFPPKH